MKISPGAIFVPGTTTAPGGHDSSITYLARPEDQGAVSDKHPISYRAAVNQRLMTNHAVPADGCFLVYDSAILDVRPLSDRDLSHISPEHATKPDSDFGFDVHFPNYRSGGGDKRATVDRRF